MGPMGEPSLTPRCPHCGAPTRPHCQPDNRCGWRVCMKDRCGSFGDPVLRRWTPPKADTERTP